MRPGSHKLLSPPPSVYWIVPLKQTLYQMVDGERFLLFLCLSCTLCPRRAGRAEVVRQSARTSNTLTEHVGCF